MVRFDLGFKRLWRAFTNIPRFVKKAFTHEYESCDRCGKCYEIWYEVKNDFWLEVVGGYAGKYCIDCFIEKVKEKGYENVTLSNFEKIGFLGGEIVVEEEYLKINEEISENTGEPNSSPTGYLERELKKEGGLI